MVWSILILAGIFEMLAITALNAYTHHKRSKDLLGMLILFALSFVALTYAMQNLPMSTAYAVWTGIGAVGGALIGMLFFKESKDIKRIICIAVILASTVGLKLLS